MRVLRIEVSTTRPVAAWAARNSSAEAPLSMPIVLSAPAATQAGAVMLTLAQWLTGQPVCDGADDD